MTEHTIVTMFEVWGKKILIFQHKIDIIHYMTARVSQTFQIRKVCVIINESMCGEVLDNDK